MNSPEYYTRETLAAAAGVSLAGFKRHVAQDVGQVSKAKEMIPGLGVRYNAARCRKYLALCHASPKRLAKAARTLAA